MGGPSGCNSQKTEIMGAGPGGSAKAYADRLDPTLGNVVLAFFVAPPPPVPEVSDLNPSARHWGLDFLQAFTSCKGTCSPCFASTRTWYVSM